MRTSRSERRTSACRELAGQRDAVVDLDEVGVGRNRQVVEQPQRQTAARGVLGRRFPATPSSSGPMPAAPCSSAACAPSGAPASSFDLPSRRMVACAPSRFIGSV